MPELDQEAGTHRPDVGRGRESVPPCGVPVADPFGDDELDRGTDEIRPRVPGEPLDPSVGEADGPEPIDDEDAVGHGVHRRLHRLELRGSRAPDGCQGQRGVGLVGRHGVGPRSRLLVSPGVGEHQS